MNLFSQEELKALISRREGPCVSMFMPTHKVGMENKQNQIRLKNLIKSAEENLAALGMRSQETREFLEPAQALVNNALFWRKQSDGLALFISREKFHHLCLPLSFEELIIVSDRYHIKPLLSLLGQDLRFYVLALSQNHLQLFDGTSQQLKEVDFENMPKSLSEALQYDEPEKQVRFRAGSTGSGGKGGMMSGHGAEIEDTKDNLLKYFRLIDRALKDFFKEERAPLIVAGVDYLFPIYKEANTYQYLMEEAITGNAKGMTTDELHKQAWKIVKPYFNKDLSNALGFYRQSLGTGLTSSDISEIVAASYHGRVAHLFIAEGAQEWGLFNPEGDIVSLNKKKEPDSEDLLDFAAIQTYANGGRVFALPPQEMPDTKSSAAVFRY